MGMTYKRGRRLVGQVLPERPANQGVEPQQQGI